MNKSLSDDDIRKYIPNVIIYDHLVYYLAHGIQNIRLPVVILYLTGENRGHWVLLHRTPEGIEFFDSYGEIPDTQFKKIPPRFQRPHYLTKLLHEFNKTSQIHYNDYPLQGLQSSTCGRWVILRHLLADTKIDTFNSAILDLSKSMGLTPDELVTKIVTI